MNAKAVDLFERINYAPLRSPGLGSYPDVPMNKNELDFQRSDPHAFAYEEVEGIGGVLHSP